MSPNKPNVTLYLGIYNGEEYIESLFKQVQAQDYQNFKILVVDNNSSDKSGEMFKEWKKVYKDRFQFVKNKVNYGGHGSLFKNMDKIDTKWFCFLHQDDFYKPNHISTIIDLIMKSSKNTVGVSTTMGSMTNSGKVLNSKPRMTWFSYNLDEPGQFLQNLRAQAIPYPASAFNLGIFKKTIVPFHSPTFSDTEQTLRMLGYGRFIISQKETMYYRENPTSESHGLNSKERTTGTIISLARVFNSIEFDFILNKVEENKRSLFANELIKALSHRIPKGDLSFTLETIALEKMISKWGYKENEISLLLAKNYASISSAATVNIINNLSNAKVRIKKVDNGIEKQTIASRIWGIYFNFNPEKFKRFNKFIIKSIYKLIFIIKPSHRLKNKWK
jgi:glycosyltransferase involved in cell wall biosynthesis